VDVVENTLNQHCVLLLRKRYGEKNTGKKYGKKIMRKSTKKKYGEKMRGKNTGKKVRGKVT
jgi:hypothetical protein